MEKTEGQKARILGLLPYAGIAASALISIAVLAAALGYTGKGGERYSIGNHFISELGQIGVSGSAWLFNAGMIVSGILFIPFCVGLGLRLKSAPGYIASAAGLCACIACAGVGIFPMNNLAPHIAFAMWYFRFGLATIFLFGIAILLQRRRPCTIPRAAVLASVPAAAAYTTFLIMAGMNTGAANPLDPATFSHRPSFWPLAFVEWLVFFTTILWFLAMAIIEANARGGRSS